MPLTSDCGRTCSFTAPSLAQFMILFMTVLYRHAMSNIRNCCLRDGDLFCFTASSDSRYSSSGLLCIQVGFLLECGFSLDVLYRQPLPLPALWQVLASAQAVCFAVAHDSIAQCLRENPTFYLFICEPPNLLSDGRYHGHWVWIVVWATE